MRSSSKENRNISEIIEQRDMKSSFACKGFNYGLQTWNDKLRLLLLYWLLMYKVTEINGVKTYNMSAGKSYSEFMESAAKQSKSLRYDN